MEENIDEEERNDRFKQADSDGDGRLNKAEFDALLHPDLHEHMVQHLVEDHLNLHDTDHDGVISFDEYMGQWPCFPKADLETGHTQHAISMYEGKKASQQRALASHLDF